MDAGHSRFEPPLEPPSPEVGAAVARAAKSSETVALGTNAMKRAGRRRGILRGPFQIADAYLFWHVAGAAATGLTRFAGLLIMFGLLTAVKRYASNQLSLAGVLELTLLSLPRVFVFTLPMSILFGTVQAFSDLSNRGEVVALGAGGMSIWRMLRAPLACAAVLAVMAFVVQETLVPACESRKNDVVRDQASKSIARQGKISIREPAVGPMKRLIQAKKFDPSTNTLIEPSIVFFKDLAPSITIRAKKGFWNQQTGEWKFLDGEIMTSSPEGEAEGVRTHIDKFGEIWRDDVPSPAKLTSSRKTRDERLESGEFEMVSIGDMKSWRSQLLRQRPTLKTADERIAQDTLVRGATFGIHDKFATPLICLVLILVGVPLGIRSQRSSSGFATGVSLIVILVYYAMWQWANTLGKSGAGNPLVFAYLAVSLTGIVGLILTAKKSH